MYLKTNLNIYLNISKYTHFNFTLGILEDLGVSTSISKLNLLAREQYYLDILFKYHQDTLLNKAPIAGSTLGFKHSS